MPRSPRRREKARCAMQIKDMMTFEVNGKKCVALVRKLTEREWDACDGVRL